MAAAMAQVMLRPVFKSRLRCLMTKNSFHVKVCDARTAGDADEEALVVAVLIWKGENEDDAEYARLATNAMLEREGRCEG